jgi:NhaP-type Na+/H+ or K+/H+ antiporter
VAGGILLGLFVGYLGSRAECLAERTEAKEKSAVLTFSFGLALVTLALCSLAGVDALLGVFAAGLVLNWHLPGDRRSRAQEVQDAYDLLFTTPMYLLLGAMLPWNDWAAMGWKVWVYPLAVMLCRRIPAVYVAHPLLSPYLSKRHRILLAWGGPIGVSSVYYAAYAARKLELSWVWPLVSLLMVASALVQGIGIAPIVRRYGRD